MSQAGCLVGMCFWHAWRKFLLRFFKNDSDVSIQRSRSCHSFAFTDGYANVMVPMLRSLHQSHRTRPQTTSHACSDLSLNSPCRSLSSSTSSWYTARKCKLGRVALFHPKLTGVSQQFPLLRVYTERITHSHHRCGPQL